MREKGKVFGAAAIGWVRENREIVRFCVLFAGVLGGFSIALQTDFAQSAIVTPHLSQIALVCGSTMRGLGTDCTIDGSTINSARFSVSVVQGCDSLYPTAMLWAALLAYPATWRSKIVGLIGGAIVLFLLNIIRVITMFYIGVFYPSLFDMVHVYAWQALFIIMTLAVWLFWASKISRARA